MITVQQWKAALLSLPIFTTKTPVERQSIGHLFSCSLETLSVYIPGVYFMMQHLVGKLDLGAYLWLSIETFLNVLGRFYVSPQVGRKYTLNFVS